MNEFIDDKKNENESTYEFFIERPYFLNPFFPYLWKLAAKDGKTLEIFFIFDIKGLVWCK
jgi:hypothetical protein